MSITQAIVTKYLSPTNTRGSRIKAECNRGSITIRFPQECSFENANVIAAQALCDKFVAEDAKDFGSASVTGNCYARKRVCGVLPNSEYAHVFID
jgi:hypothetical protein